MCQGPEIEELGFLKELREGHCDWILGNIQKYTKKWGYRRGPGEVAHL